MTEAEEKLESIHQMRTSMQKLDLPDLPETQKNQALENLFDAYQICHAEYALNPSVDELKKSLIDSVSLKIDEENLPNTLQKIKDLRKLWSFSYFKQDDFLNVPFFSTVLEKLSEQVSALQQSNARLEEINASRKPIDAENIKNLLNKAATITSNQKKATTKQKTADKNKENFKQFIESAFAKRQKLPLDQVTITKIELQEIDGKPKLILTDEKQQTTIVPVMFTSKGKKPLFGGNVETESNMKPLYAYLQKEKSLTFSAPQQTQQAKKERINVPQEFSKLTKSQAPDLKKELEAYNILLAQKPKDAADLLEKLKDKYCTIAQKQEKEKILQGQEQLKENIEKNINTFKNGIKVAFEKIPTNNMLALSAPASGQNQDMLPHRQHFAKVINLLCQTKALSNAYKKMIFSLRNEETFWKDMNDSYYPQIKKLAQDNYYQTLAQQMFKGTNPQKVLKEVSANLSPDLAKKVLARAVIVYGMGNTNREPNPKKTNEILKSFGYQISLNKVKVEKNTQKIKSKFATAIMRCLADGHPLDITKFDSKEQALLRIQKQQLKETFGKDKNYESLVNCVINDKPAQKAVALTPYQIHNMKIGLVAALSPKATNQIDFCEKIKHSQPDAEQKQWDIDDYLFTKYMSLYFQQDVSPSNKELIKKLKNGYDWEGFKNKNKSASKEIYQDLTALNQQTETTIFNALIEGKLKGEQHHYNPLKNAVFSEDPVSYNNFLVTSVQHNLWQENPHQLHHLATTEGTDMIPPYCVQTSDGKFTRRGQIDVEKETEKDDVCIYFESLQIQDKKGQYHDLIPEGAFYISSAGLIVSEPQLTPKALDFHHQKIQTNAMEK